MTPEASVIVAALGLVGILIVQGTNVWLSMGNRRKLDATKTTLAQQNDKLQEIHVQVNGNLEKLQRELATAVARINELTVAQNRVVAATEAVGELPTKAALLAVVARVTSVTAATPEASEALAALVTRVRIPPPVPTEHDTEEERL